jgi:flagellar hook assembly protein FlgD
LTETDISPSDSSLLPLTFNLSQNYPNPFNGSTIIKYSLPRLSDVDISIYNILGQKVISLVAAMQPTGDYQINWHGIDWKGNPLASGIYFYCLKTDNYQSIKKMVLLK